MDAAQELRPPEFAVMGTYRVFTKGLRASIRIVVEGQQVVSGLREAYAARTGLDALAEASLELFRVPAPPTGAPTQAEANAAETEANRLEEGVGLEQGVYYLAVDTRPQPRTGGGGGPGVAEIVRMSTETAFAVLDKRAALDRMDPFLHSHHTESVSVASSQAFPRTTGERQGMKRQVAAYYGLRSEEGYLVDMTGTRRETKDVQLAHIWPRSYQNWDAPCEHLGLPGGFYQDVRNFLLLPQNLHQAFDAGHVVFIPKPQEVVDGVARRRILIQVIRHDKLLAFPDVIALHNTHLHIPTPSLPYCRLLAFFALMAKKHVDVGLDTERLMRAAVDDGTDSAGGRSRLRDAADDLVTFNKVKLHHSA